MNFYFLHFGLLLFFFNLLRLETVLLLFSTLQIRKYICTAAKEKKKKLSLGLRTKLGPPIGYQRSYWST